MAVPERRLCCAAGLVAGVVWEHVRRGKPGRAESGGRLPKSHEHVGTRALEIPRIFELLPLAHSALYLISFKAGKDAAHLLLQVYQKLRYE